jgi:hypothetical protein
LETPKLLKAYEEAFDLVLIGDDDFDEIKALIDELW